MKLFFAFALIFLLLHLTRSDNLWPSQDECGKLNKDNFANPIKVTELNEHPWVARVAVNLAGKIRYTHVAVLITRRYLLSLARTQEMYQSEIDHVLLGDWDAKNNPDEIDCDELGKCAPQPKMFQVEEIVIHPDFKNFQNDIALLRLTTDVIFSDYIRPICMPPKESDDNFYTGQYLPYTGFLWRWNDERRSKALLYVISTKSCAKALESQINIDDKQICGIINSNIKMFSGSPLMAVRLVDGEPHNLYLLGMITAGTLGIHNKYKLDILVRVSSYRDWIEYNVVE